MLTQARQRGSAGPLVNPFSLPSCSPSPLVPLSPASFSFNLLAIYTQLNANFSLSLSTCRSHRHLFPTLFEELPIREKARTPNWTITAVPLCVCACLLHLYGCELKKRTKVKELKMQLKKQMPCSVVQQRRKSQKK